MYKLSLKELKDKIATLEFDRFDKIVAVSKRGHLAAQAVSEHIGTEWITLEKAQGIGGENIRILLVDDIINSGKSLVAAKEQINISDVKTFAIAGNADYYIFKQPGCVKVKKGWLW